jgi:DNA-directed RNA polymerase sigma subunit (sigma70/sigma32)
VHKLDRVANPLDLQGDRISAPHALEEIGRGLAVTRERVRQIESAALERMASFREMRDITG